jgi:mRNA interferase RelE/StbE
VGTGQEGSRPVAPPYRIEIKQTARKTLASFPRAIQKRIQVKIDELAWNPRPPGAKQLKGPEGFLRIRIGEYRVVYSVKKDMLIILVIRIVHRREAYRLPIA